MEKRSFHSDVVLPRGFVFTFTSAAASSRCSDDATSDFGKHWRFKSEKGQSGRRTILSVPTRQSKDLDQEPRRGSRRRRRRRRWQLPRSMDQAPWQATTLEPSWWYPRVASHDSSWSQCSRHAFDSHGISRARLGQFHPRLCIGTMEPSQDTTGTRQIHSLPWSSHFDIAASNSVSADDGPTGRRSFVWRRYNGS